MINKKKSRSFSKWLKVCLPILLASLMSFAFGACGNNGKPENELTPTPPPEDNETLYPEDKGPYTAYRMEAESAVHSIVGGTVFTDNSNVRFDLRMSGCLATSNLSQIGTTHTFAFSSDKALSYVPLKIMVGGYPNEDLLLSDFLDVKVNGASQNLRGLTVRFNDCELLGQNQYMIFKPITLFIDVAKGENQIVLEHVAAKAGNLDYIELQTSATITGWQDTYADTAAVWEVTTDPTETSEGTIRVTSSGKTATYILPELAEGNGYNIVSDGITAEYSFVLKGQKYTFTVVDTSKIVYTFTLQNGTVDGAATGEFYAREELSLVYSGTLPAGRTHLGWYNVDDETEIFSGNSFTMPAKNITLAPYFTTKGAAATLGSNGTDNESTDVDRSKFAFTTDSTVVIDDDGCAVLAGTATYGGTLKSTSYFRIKSHYLANKSSVTIASGTVFCYTIRNDGAQAVKFKLVPAGSKLTPLGGTELTGEITLNAGDTFSVSFTYVGDAFSSANAIALFYITAATAEPLNIAVAVSYALGE